jgi:hypothetical protein
MPNFNLSDIPWSVVIRAQEDTDFALRLLDTASREEALSDPDLGLSDEQMRDLRPILDEVARMSFQEAIQTLRDEAGVSIM